MTDHDEGEIELRRRAELKLRPDRQDPLSCPIELLPRLVHELQIHQTELKMQNKELRRTQHELEAARDSYAELYDFAPLGYFSLNEQGQILRANIAGARLLGTDRPGLRGKRLYQFTVVEQRDALYRHLRDTFRTKPRQSREVEMLRGDGSRFFARLDSVAQTAEEGKPRQCLTLVSDISAQRRAQALTQAASQLAERTSAAFTPFRPFHASKTSNVVSRTGSGRNRLDFTALTVPRKIASACR